MLSNKRKEIKFDMPLTPSVKKQQSLTQKVRKVPSKLHNLRHLSYKSEWS